MTSQLTAANYQRPISAAAQAAGSDLRWHQSQLEQAEERLNGSLTPSGRLMWEQLRTHHQQAIAQLRLEVN